MDKVMQKMLCVYQYPLNFVDNQLKSCEKILIKRIQKHGDNSWQSRITKKQMYFWGTVHYFFLKIIY